MRLTLGFVLLILVQRSAIAAEWRYCLAPLPAEHKIYMTQPFTADMAANEAESAFARTLMSSGLRPDDVQCPQSESEASSLVMRQYAVTFNRILGNDTVDVHWRPGRAMY